MSVDKKILKELERYNSINKYIMEQAEPPIPEDPAAALPPAPGGEVPVGEPEVPGAEVAPPPPAAPAAEENKPVDVAADPDVEEIGGEEEGEEGDVEELDITELVDAQTSIADKQEEYFNNLFDQLNKMQEKLGEMDQIVTKIDSLEAKVEKMRPKTAQEKLELRALDSGPFKQKLSDFFQDKMVDMEKTGKEYVLTADEVENYSPSDVESSFDEYLPKATDFTK
jgi:hypothetical protein